MRGMLKYLFLCLPISLLIGGCAADPWKDVPDFEVADFICPVPGGKFLDHTNFVANWSVLGPLDPGKNLSLHTELLRDEALLNGNCRAPRGIRWCRAAARNEDEAETEPGAVDFSARFKQHSRGQQKSVFYACATLKCDREYKGITLYAAGCGQLKIWINGKTVYSREHGTENLKSGIAKVEDLMLVKGCNRLVLKYMDDGKDFWNRRRFSVRFTDAAGNLSNVR